MIGYMKDFLFRPDQDRTPVGVLSGGERARLTLARAFARPSNLLVLDEPTNDLDLETLDLLFPLGSVLGATVAPRLFTFKSTSWHRPASFRHRLSTVLAPPVRDGDAGQPDLRQLQEVGLARQVRRLIGRSVLVRHHRRPFRVAKSKN